MYTLIHTFICSHTVHSLPEVSAVGKIKDIFFPQPRLDFYALVQAKKRKDSPHGVDTQRPPEGTGPVEEGVQYKPKVVTNLLSKEQSLGPYY